MNYGKEIWGPKAWNLLHSFSMTNKKISNTKKHNYYIFYTTFIYIIPCLKCSDHYSEILYNKRPLIEENINKKYLKKWVFNIHNDVNIILKKNKYSFKDFIENDYIIEHCEIFFFIDIVYKNLDYKMMSLYKYDQIYNFFINFCNLYPTINIRKNLRKVIKSIDFINIKTPNEFKNWYIETSNLLNNIICK